jgi:D-alanyl-D-alanine carboxypeptidase
MKRYLWLCTALILSVAACRKPAVSRTQNCSYNGVDSSNKHPKNSQYKSILDKYHKLGLPGISVLTDDESGVWFGSAGKADILQNTNFQPCTVSKLGSITKMMLATAIFKLHETGKINLDDKISLHLNNKVIEKVKNAEAATLRDLMRHNTGIYDIIADGGFYLAVVNNPNKHWTAEELIAFAYNKPANFSARTSVQYSNTNTLLAAMVVDAIRPDGKDHAQWMKELVFDKVGMPNTYYHSHDALPPQTARGYFDLYQNGTLTDVSNMITGSGFGFTGVYSNVFDMHGFMKALFIDRKLLNQTSLLNMQTFAPSTDTATDIGSGLLLEYKSTGHSGVGHTGGDLGYAAVAHYFPGRNNRILIYCVNYGTNGNSALREVYSAFREELAKALLE